MPNTIITRMGLDFATSASTYGTLIAPLYFVPVYDYRIDSLIHDSTIPTCAFSACVDVDATEPTGEILWNTSAVDYTLSDINQNFLIDAGSAVSAGNKILNPVQSQKWQINLKNGVPLSDHWTGTSAAFDPNGGPAWNISTDTILSTGSNPTPTGLDKYFPVSQYYPVSADTPDSRIRGNIKCRLSKDIGECKFNAVAIYIAQQDVYGAIIPSEPVFFAEVKLKTTVVKTHIANNGFDDITVDCQLDLHSLSADWAEVFFSTSGDYWSRNPNGLYYPEKVGIGEFDGATDESQATLHVRPPRSAPTTKLVRFERGRNYIVHDVTSAGVNEDTLYSNTFSASNGTQMEILDAGHGALSPLSASSMDLGKNAVRFRTGYFDDVIAATNVSAGNNVIATNTVSGGTAVIGKNLYATEDTYTRDVYASRDIIATRDLYADRNAIIAVDVNVGNDVNAINDVNAANRVNAYNSVYAQHGNVVSSEGDVIAYDDVYAQNGDIHAYTGDIYTEAGNVSAVDGHYSGNVLAHGYISAAGNVSAENGRFSGLVSATDFESPDVGNINDAIYLFQHSGIFQAITIVPGTTFFANNDVRGSGTSWGANTGTIDEIDFKASVIGKTITLIGHFRASTSDFPHGGSPTDGTRSYVITLPAAFQYAPDSATFRVWPVTVHYSYTGYDGILIAGFVNVNTLYIQSTTAANGTSNFEQLFSQSSQHINISFVIQYEGV